MGFEMSLSPVVNLFVMFGGRLIHLSVIIHMGAKCAGAVVAMIIW
jgi:hypothetical protein